MFRLYDDPSAGNLLGSQTVNPLAVTNGLFTVTLNANNEFGTYVFDGEARWLAITVNGTTLTPRQALTATPYAQSLAPGAVISGPPGFLAGVLNVTATDSGIALWSVGHTADDGGVVGANGDLSSYGILGWGEVGVYGSSPAGYSGYFPDGNAYFGGNVGIGTTTPSYALAVDQDAPGNGVAAFTNRSTSGFAGAYFSDNTGTRGYVGYAATQGWCSGGTMQFGSVNADLVMMTGCPERMRIKADTGNVGIGTATPTSKLDVAGAAEMDGFKLNGNGAGAGKVLISDSSGVGTWQSPPTPSQWQNNASAIYYNGGNVGVGTSTPSAMLDVAGQLACVGFKMRSPGAVAGQVLVCTDAAGNAQWQNQPYWFFGTGGIYTLSNVGIGNLAPTYPLDVTGAARISGALTTGSITSGTISASSTSTAISASSSSHTISASSSGSGKAALYGNSTIATGEAFGVYGKHTASSAWAVYALGDFGASGLKWFHIDDPRDPTNRYLNHCCLEGPEPYNVYNGVITTDEHGVAWVELPGYFEALNRDYRYQLTVADDGDDFVQAKVWRKIDNNQFAIRTSAPNVEVYWQVTGVRNDPAANRALAAKPVEQLKTGDAVGKYLQPELYGQPPEMAQDYEPPAVEPAPLTNEPQIAPQGTGAVGAAR